MVQSEDNLFRQFRLPWVPAWVPDWVEAPLRSQRLWSALALFLLTSLLTYGGWRLLQAQTGQADIDLRVWEQRLSTAEPRERPLLLEAVFQLPNDGAIALGLAYLHSPDAQERRIASLALRDAAEQWNQWPISTATAQYERTVRLLADIVSSLHAPEQALAVDLARQAMTRPALGDPTLRDSLRAQALAVMSRANSAHSAGLLAADPRVPSTDPTQPSPSGGQERDRLTLPGLEATRSTPPAAARPPRTTDPTREWEFSSSGPDGRVAGGGTANAANRYLPAGFARPPRDPNSTPSTPDADSTGAPASQVPLFDDRGRRIEIRTLDPAQLSVPGGLIPVEMSDVAPALQTRGTGPRVSESSFRRPGNTDRDAVAPDRIGSARMADNVNAGPGNVTGNSPVVPLDTLRRELAVALERREQDLIATQRDTTAPRYRPAANDRPAETEITTSRPALAPPVADRLAPPVADREAAAFPTPQRSTDVTNSPRPSDGIPGRTVAAPRGETTRQRLPSNPYRRSESDAATEFDGLLVDDTSLNNPSATNRVPNPVPPNTDAMAPFTPGPDAGRPPGGTRRQVPRPTTNLARLPHIEVMQMLRSPDPNRVNAAVQELGQRGFNPDYVAVARRLTSPDANERYQLVFDLLSSTRVDPNPFLRWLATDPDPEVQSLAIEALEMLNASGKNRAVDATATPGLRR